MSDEDQLKNEVSRPAQVGKKRSRLWVAIAAAIMVCAVGVGYFWSGTRAKSSSQPQGVGRGTPVAAVPTRTGDMSIYINGIGSVVPLNTVTVKTRVDGQLMEVLFKEGQTVKAGQRLVKIDPRPFQVQLEQAEGQMERDQALLKNSHLDLERYQVLWKQDSIPKQQLDTQEALVRQYQAAVKADQAAIDSARLQLTYCLITSPIDGRIGLRLVDPGNIVHAADTNGLVVITQLEPISVIFTIPEDNLSQVFAGLKGGKRLPVDAYDREQVKKLATGHLLTVDNQVDPTTGTVRLKAIFENRDNGLFPNQFVNARLFVDTKRDALIVPSAAIQRGPQGTFVFVVKPDKTVDICPVTIGEIQGGDVSIRVGLVGSELVVVDGAEKLRKGTPVELRGQGNQGINGQRRN